MARSAVMHVSISRLQFGSNCLQRQLGCCHLVEEPNHHNALKHMNVRYHFVQDYVTTCKLSLEKISTTEIVADGMTKCLLIDRFRSLRHQMGLREISMIESDIEMTSDKWL